MAEAIKIGIIGLGGIGEYHASTYQSNEAAKITAVCDIDAKKLSDQADRLNVKHRFTDYHKLLEADVEAVSICVGNTLHRDVAIAALEAGKHVLLEKPMALDAAEAAEILAAADKADTELRIGMVHRHRPICRVARDYVEQGALGEIYHMRVVYTRRRGIPGLGGWFTTKAQSGGGPLIDLGVHFFDLAMWLAGYWNPSAVSAQTYAKFGPRMADYKYVSMWAGPPRLDGVFDVEDYAAGFVRFAEQATLSFEMSWAGNSEDEMYVAILGDKGGLRISGDSELKILTEDRARVADITPHFNTDANQFEIQADEFLRTCRGETSPAATGQEGLVVMKLIDAIYASSKAGGEVKVTT